MKRKTNSLIVPLLFVFLFSCAEKNSNAVDQANASNPIDTGHTTAQEVSGGNQNLMDRINDLKNSMIDYMKSSGPSYTDEDIDACVKILTQYVTEIKQTSSKEDGMAAVKSAVLKLNRLNEKCGSELIETGEREQIAQIIILASSEKGYSTAGQDITEAWREW